MRNILLFVLLLFVCNSCARQKIYKAYPNCVEYFEFLEKSWSRKDNGFFVIEEVPDSTKPEWAKYVEPPQFQQQWDKYKDDCLCNLNEKEVKAIFGKPTRMHTTFRAIKKITTTTYGYHIADKSCDEEAQKKTRINICSYMAFTFSEGKQNSKLTGKPRLSLKDEYD